MSNQLPASRLPRILVATVVVFGLVIWANLAATRAARAGLPALPSPAPAAVPTAPTAQASAHIQAPVKSAWPKPQALPAAPDSLIGENDRESALPWPTVSATAARLLTLLGFSLLAAWTAAGRARPAWSSFPGR